MNTQSKISIATIGLESAHLGILEFLISYYFKDDFFLIKQRNGKEKVCIFRITSDKDYKALISHKEQNPTILLVAITKHKLNDETIECISPPLSPRKIKDVLHNIKDQINKKTKLSKTLKKEKKVDSRENKNNSKPSVANKTRGKGSIPIPPVLPTNTATVVVEKEAAKIDDLHELIGEIKSHLPLDTSKSEVSTTHTTKTITIKNKAKGNKKKQIAIEEDNSKFIASRTDVNLNNPAIVASLVYSTDEYLQGALAHLYAKAKHENKIITLDMSYGMISYNPKNHKAFVNVSLTTLQNISSMADLKATYLPQSQSPDTIPNANWENADALLWKTTIWASRGRLPMGADIDTPFILKNWPNFTRFMLTPHAMEMTALWIHEPITLRKTLALLAIPQRTVFSFYSAVTALDLVIFTSIQTRKKSIKKQPKDKGMQQVTPPIKKKKRRFFSKLLNYFKPDKIEEI